VGQIFDGICVKQSFTLKGTRCRKNIILHFGGSKTKTNYTLNCYEFQNNVINYLRVSFILVIFEAKHGAANFRINFLKKLGVTLRARLNDHTKNEVSKELLNKFMQDLKSQEEITSLNTEISRIKLENLQLRRKLVISGVFFHLV
jgi:hypothetical protein